MHENEGQASRKFFGFMNFFPGFFEFSFRVFFSKCQRSFFFTCLPLENEIETKQNDTYFVFFVRIFERLVMVIIVVVKQLHAKANSAIGILYVFQPLTYLQVSRHHRFACKKGWREKCGCLHAYMLTCCAAEKTR